MEYFEVKKDRLFVVITQKDLSFFVQLVYYPVVYCVNIGKIAVKYDSVV